MIAIALVPRVDVWALGVLMFECLVGKPPFEEPDSTENTHQAIVHRELSFTHEASHLSSAAKALITGLLQKDQDRRLTLDDVLAHPFLAHGVAE